MEDLPALWEAANLVEYRKFLLTVLDAVYINTVDNRSIVSIQPKPVFQPLFAIATTRKGSDVVPNKQDALGSLSTWGV